MRRRDCWDGTAPKERVWEGNDEGNQDEVCIMISKLIYVFAFANLACSLIGDTDGGSIAHARNHSLSVVDFANHC